MPGKWFSNRINMAEGKENKSALNIQKGIQQPEQFNREAVRKIAAGKHKALAAADFVKGIRDGNRTILSQAITLVESSLSAHQQKAQEIIEECIKSLRVTRDALHEPVRIGITGVPGAGKSTFIEALGKYLTDQGHKVAVLAVDPSSQKSKGSILGDKTRMEELAVDLNAFIRPSPSAGSLGGVARKTRESIILCEAAGYDVIFVETVGVGQSETTVRGMVDFFLLLLIPGAGDELQGIKRGIIEMADLLVVNKADGDNIQRARIAKTEYTNALHLYPPSESGWNPTVETCSSKTKEGIPEVWRLITGYIGYSRSTGYFLKNRMEQNKQVFTEYLEESLKRHFFSQNEISKEFKKAEKEISDGNLNPYSAAKEILAKYFHPEKK
jgi:LAO/AO transport system kinase